MEALLARAEPREPFFGGRDPTVADYFVYESLSRGCDVFADAFERALRAAPALSALRSAMDARPRIEAYRRAGRVPYRVTASPSEPVLRARLVEDLPTSPGRDG
jgi:glutathione S-transferase